MRKRVKLAPALVLDFETINLKLIAVEDDSGNSIARSTEVTEIAMKAICLASKRGRLKKDKEVYDEKKAA